jgi:ABC-2 type transport system ATP-binding protein
VRIRCDGGAAMLGGLPGVGRIDDHGQLVEVDVDGDAQVLLKALVAKTRVTLFELARPSLHDIFVEIAKPSPEHLGGAEVAHA